MQFQSTAHAEASERVGIHNRDGRDASIIYTGTYFADGVYVHGTPAQRADFLRRLADAANEAADELSPRIETDGVPALKAVRA